MTHSVVIVDDEPPARAKLLRFLAPLPEFQVVAQADTVETAVQEITAHRPDIVYLDIQLGDRSGFEVIEAIRGQFSAHIVFTTAYSEYAVQAFDVQALDYLLKPFDRERFLRSVERVKVELAEPDQGDFEERVRRVLANLPGQPAPIKQILVRDRARAYFIPVDGIDRLTAAGNYVEIHAGGKVHLVREPLAKLDQTLLGALDTAAEKMLYQFSGLRAKAGRAEGFRTGVLNTHENEIASSLWPNNALQERSFGLLAFLAAEGPELLDVLDRCIKTGSGEHGLVSLPPAVKSIGVP